MPEAQKHLRCRDVGMDCDFEAHGASDEDVMRQAATHAERVHGIREIPPDLAERVRRAIRAD